MIRQTHVRAATLAAVLLAACSSSTATGPCDPAAIPAGLGCEFWPTVTANAVDGDLAFGVALVNPGSVAASVRIEGGAIGTALDVTVPAGTSVHQTLPWVDALKACTATGGPCTGATGTSVVSSGGAYRVTSTQPLAVYQFSPLLGSVDPASADATALPGAHALGRSYVVTAWGAIDGIFPGFVAVTAVADATTVQITATATVQAGDVPAFAPGVQSAVTLNRGDVLQLLAYAGDLTGTRVDADKPVQLVGGHFCALVPTTVAYCDHLEEVVPAVSALGTSYVLAPPTPPNFPTPVVVRVVGTEDGTGLSYSASVPGAPATLGAGQFADFELGDMVQITANHPVLVAEYLVGAGIAGSGDPSFAIAPPVARWRTSYVVDLPEPVGGHVDVISPAGATVRFDGGPLWLPPAATGYVYTSVGLGGMHRFEADRPFGISVYGYTETSSYWYAPAFAP